MNLHTLERCKTWKSYHNAYLHWMIKYSHPGLAASNYNADKLREELECVE